MHRFYHRTIQTITVVKILANKRKCRTQQYGLFLFFCLKNNNNAAQHVPLLARLFEIFIKPIARLLNPFLNSSKLVIGQKLAQFVVGRRLFELPIRLGGIKFHLAFKLHGLGHGEGDILDTHFIGFIDRQGNGGRIVIVRTHGPNGQFGQVAIVNELTQGCTTAPNGKGSVVLFGQVTLVNQSWNDVSSFNGKVVKGSVNVLG